MNEKERLFVLAYRLAEARLRKSGPVFSEKEILEDFPYPTVEPIARGQWCEVRPLYADQAKGI